MGACRTRLHGRDGRAGAGARGAGKPRQGGAGAAINGYAVIPNIPRHRLVRSHIAANEPAGFLGKLWLL